VQRKKTRGLQFREGIWQIDKVVLGERICCSTGTSNFEEAELVMAQRISEIRQRKIYGVRPPRTFRTAATKYLTDFAGKRSIERDARALKDLDPFIGDVLIDRLHWDTLQPYAKARPKLKQGTLNRHFAVVRRILNLCARLWRDDAGKTWLETAPLLPLPKANERPPYPLSWDEQRLFFSELAPHLEVMALFMTNTGTRDQEVCELRWDWENRIRPGVSVFVVPGDIVKNMDPRVVILNDVAQSIIEDQRGRHETHVFAFTQRQMRIQRRMRHQAVRSPEDLVYDAAARPVDRMYNSGWKKARLRAANRYKEEFGQECPSGFRRIRVHDMKHTFGRRLRAAGVRFEDRQELLGHRNASVTTHYSGAEIDELRRLANLVNEKRESSVLLRVVQTG
jgi:integrase